MAEVTHVKRVVEVVETEVSPAYTEVRLTEEEMKNLRALLGYGMSGRSLHNLGLYDLYNQLTNGVDFRTLSEQNPGFVTLADTKSGS